MTIFEASEKIKILYQTSCVDEETWQLALQDFSTALANEDCAEKLETCILADINWEISVDERLQLIRKAKLKGAKSAAFLKDYYGYLAAHLDPSSEKEYARVRLQELMKLT